MKRLLTAFVAIPLALLVTFLAPDWLMAIIVGLVSALMLHEFLQLTATVMGDRPGSWFLFAAVSVAASFVGGAAWVLTALAASTISLLAVGVFAGDLKRAIARVSAGLSGLLYCAFLFGFIIWLSRDSILMVFGIVWAGDTAAYYGGRAFGRHSLAAKISPKKTIEGAIAGLIGSAIVGTAVGLWRLGEPWTSLVWISVLTAIAGQVGDLAESALKRSAGVKDSSSILPGHGGILDRLDSLLFAVPIFYWLLNA